MSTEKIEEIKITQTVEQKAIAKEAEELLLKAESVKNGEQKECFSLRLKMNLLEIGLVHGYVNQT